MRVEDCGGISLGEFLLCVANDHTRLTDRAVADYDNFDLIILSFLGLNHLNSIIN